MAKKEMVYSKERKIELLCKDNYKGFNYYILNLGTHPTAYIEIPKGHLLYGMSYGEIYDKDYNIDVHGGLTYSDNHLQILENGNWFIGWDYAHWSDYMPFYDEISISLKKWTTELKKWTTDEIIEECKKAIEQIEEIK